MGAVTSCVTDPCTPASQRSSSSESGIFDAYEIGELLGSGAFGQVRACWSVGEKDDGAYAVKVIDTLGEGTASQLPVTEEGNILQAVRHQHIVELVDIFMEERWLFVVEERITGGELFQAFADQCLTVTESCVAIAGYQLLQALQYLHDRSIVHRDVKAENILLASSPAISGRWEIKLVDFGLAMRMEQQPLFLRICREQSDMPLDEIICGTAYYCAPEVWANSYGPKVDVWACGVMMYLALYGTYPFYDKDPNVIEALICQEDAGPPWKAVCEKEHPGYQASQAARDCLATLLEKDPSERSSAGKALKDPWLRRGRSLRGTSSRNGYPTAVGYSVSKAPPSSASAGSTDPVIPFGIRTKAGRAAARPAVSEAKELGRTAALEALQARTLLPSNMVRLKESNRSKVRPISAKLPASQTAIASIADARGLSAKNCLTLEVDSRGTIMSSEDLAEATEDEGEETARHNGTFCY